jgi:hypothetical protein
MADSKLRDLVAAVEAKVAVDPSEWSTAERLTNLLELFAVREILEIAIVDKLREIARGTVTL